MWILDFGLRNNINRDNMIAEFGLRIAEQH
jgi:hypothetical protein